MRTHAAVSTQMDRAPHRASSRARAPRRTAGTALLAAVLAMPALASCKARPAGSMDTSAAPPVDTSAVATVDTSAAPPVDSATPPPPPPPPPLPAPFPAESSTVGRRHPGARGGRTDTSAGEATAPPNRTGALARLRPGAFRVTHLDSMTVGRPRDVYVFVRRRAAGEPRPDTGLHGGTFRDTLPVGDSAKVCLTARPADFEIAPAQGACVTQPVLAGLESRWRWTVTPVGAGPRPLNLSIDMLVTSLPFPLVDTSYVLTVAVAPRPWWEVVIGASDTTHRFVASVAGALTAIAGLAAAVRALVHRSPGERAGGARA